MPHPITQPCGTYAAAARHTRRGEPLCEPCVEARRAWWRERARIAYSIPAYRARENARTASRLRRRRQTDTAWAERVNRQRKQRRAAERAAARDAVDTIAVERAIAGDRSVALTRAEKTAAVQQLLAAGRGPGEIAARLHMSGQSVRAYATRGELEVSA